MYFPPSLIRAVGGERAAAVLQLQPPTGFHTKLKVRLLPPPSAASKERPRCPNEAVVSRAGRATL